MMSTRFDWSDFYLICFAVGFCFSFFSFVFGGSRFGRLHLPHFHGHGIPSGGGAAHAPVAGGHAPVAQGPSEAQTQGTHQGLQGSNVSPFNPPSLAAFLAWVGLGADGLSSSAYGPEEAFKALGTHTYLAVALAGATALTVFVISYAYSRIIEHFHNSELEANLDRLHYYLGV